LAAGTSRGLRLRSLRLFQFPVTAMRWMLRAQTSNSAAMDSMGRSVSSYQYLIVAVSFSVYSAMGDAPLDKAV
jgi:ABC-type uncharacterized transport system permease subunit